MTGGHSKLTYVLISILFTLFVVGMSVLFVLLNLPVLSLIIFLCPIPVFVLIKIFHINYQKIFIFLISGGIILGWRGIEIFQDLKIYPSEFFIWLGFAIYLLVLVDTNQYYLNIKLPLQAVFLLISAFIGLIVALQQSNLFVLALAETKAFIIFLPLIILLREWIKTIQDILLPIRVMVFSGAVIALLGIIEKFFPSITGHFSWLFSNPIYTRNNFILGSDVELAGFSFWGGTIVSVFLVMAVGLWISAIRSQKGLSKLIWNISGLVLIVGIFIGGYRSAWVGLAMVFLSLFFYDKSLAIFLFSVGGATFYRLPLGFRDRVRTIFLLNQSGDTSIIRRIQGFSEGLITLRNNLLLGNGWNSPVVYNDWLYLGIVLGLPAIILLIYWYFSLLVRLRKITIRFLKKRKTEEGQIALGFFVGIAGYALCMFSGAMVQVPPLMVTFWVFFCLAWRFTEMIFLEMKKEKNGKIVSFTSNL